MTNVPQDRVGTANNRLTREDVTPGQDPRERDAGLADADAVAARENDRPVRHADQLADPATEMGTSSSRDIEADDPLEHDA